RRYRARGVAATRESSVDGVDGQSGLLLFAAGLAGGVVTAMVGGASLITFPALLAAGLPAIVANASNTVALTPGNLAAGLADLERIPRWDRSFASLALLSVSRADEFRTANVIKNLLSGLTSFVAVVVFVLQGIVAWPPTLVVMAGAVIGGFLGGRLARVLSPELMRGIVITVGTVLT